MTTISLLKISGWWMLESLVEKPLLICQLMSPGYFGPGNQRYATRNQELPPVNICDYTLLDLPLLPNFTYDGNSYDFISRAGHRLLFNAGLEWLKPRGILSVASSRTFQTSVSTAQNSLDQSKIYGLGFMKGLPILEKWAGVSMTKENLDSIYSSFYNTVVNTGVSRDDVRNFFAFKPNEEATRKYMDYLTLLNRITVSKRANKRRQLQPHPDIKLRVDENQNVLTISTSSEYIATALRQITKLQCTQQPMTSPLMVLCLIIPKGVVNRTGHEITPDDFLSEVEVPGYEVLTCRRLGNSGEMVLTFCGKRVPFFVNAYGQALRCYLYKRTIPHCRKCNKTGHHEIVCPQPPDTPKF
ncbi:hypothetical protein HPB51_005982 [Rhipicephalus microplus]|uniref:Uncharacterized protein n=1 Tax=Rhipicephalus microplus TaxID=6941 RepID=A0A9J6DLI9_RHIMP|nr:hypothetical protein HPB51_005982 [Rhipicephalus microplus]